MGLENANYINELDQNNPVGSEDLLSQGDNHLRMTKLATQQTFPNMNSAMTISSGTLNAIRSDLVYNPSTDTFDAMDNVIKNVKAIDRGDAVQPKSYNDNRYISPDKLITADIKLANNEGLRLTRTNASTVNGIKMNTANTVIVGTDSLETEIRGSTISFEGNVELAGTSILNKVYPIGSIYTNANTLENPRTLLGFGTWAKWAEGRIDVCKSNDTEFAVIGKTGGAYEHALTVSQLPAHSHTLLQSVPYSGGIPATYVVSSSTVATVTTPNNGLEGEAHENRQPSIVVAKWIRTG